MLQAVCRVAALALIIAVAPACKDKPPDGKPVEEGAPRADERDLPPLPVVTDDAKDLLFSFVGADGQVQAVSHVTEVPEPIKPRVLVVDLAKTPEQRQAHRYAFFADLMAKKPDGTYPVSVVSRYDAARGQNAPAIAPPPDGSVVVYSAVWCGFCKKAKAWLTERGVPFVERDVEKTPGAQEELSSKLKAAGVPGGGVPVIDWAGTIVMGFDVAAMERLLKEKPPAKPAHPPPPTPAAPSDAGG